MFDKLKRLFIQSNPELILLLITGLLRVIPAIKTPISADLSLHLRIGYYVLLGKSPYSITDIYTPYAYPPVWMWFDAGAVWLSSIFDLPFQLLIKLPIILSDAFISIIIYKLLFNKEKKKALFMGFIYAINPVSILITGFHGQFDSLPILIVLMAIYYLKSSKRWLSPVLLSLSIALKSFPVLLLPFFLFFHCKTKRERINFILFSLLPVLVILLPYLLSDFSGIWRQLFSYSGFPDYGWVATVRGFIWISSMLNAIWSGKTEFITYSKLPILDYLLSSSKFLFLFIYGLFFYYYYFFKRHQYALFSLVSITFCLFYLIYGGISSQYLLWIVPFLILIDWKISIFYSLFATLALFGFYQFFFPDVIKWFFASLGITLTSDFRFYVFSSILFYIALVITAARLLIPKWIKK